MAAARARTASSWDTAQAQGKRIIEKIGQGDLAHLLTDEQDELTERKINQKDDFSKRRWRCIQNPDRALETLGPYARLELTIHAANNLLPRDSWTNLSTTDPRVGVFLDDIKLEGKGMQTLVVRNTTAPLWGHRMNIDIVCPRSMVRLQVYDDQVTHQIEQGFVEFSVADIPYNTPIKGWLELRFQDNLRQDSVRRYASHCAVREDTLDLPNQADNTDVTLQQVSTKSNLGAAKVTVEDLKARRMVGIRAAEKTRTLLHSCSHTCGAKVGISSTNRGPSAEEDRGNAGEIYIELKLVKVVGSISSKFALALDMPAPKPYGDYVQEEDPEAKQRRSLDLQKCMDTITDLRNRLLEDFILCLYYYVKYIGTWRTPIISAPVFLCLCMCCVHSYYAAAILPGLGAALLVLNGWPGLRRNMTRGGLNAMMNEEGFKHVAKWRQSGEMMWFLKRVVENDLNGSATDLPKLKLVASQCFRDGVPTVKFTELRHMLKSKTDIVSLDAFADVPFMSGDKVIIDERQKATVSGYYSNDQILVVYDGDAPSPKNDAAARPPPESKPVELSRVRRRHKINFYQTWLLPRKVSNTIVDVMETIGTIEQAQVYPAVEFVTEVVTWRRKCPALAICLALAVLSASLVWVESYYDHDSDGFQLNKPEEYASHVTVEAIRYLDNAIQFVIVFVLLILNANWFVTVKSILRIFSRMCSERRNAPDHWAFFREDLNMQDRLDAIPDKHFPDIHDLKGGIPDMMKLQRHLEALPGLRHFKVPDFTHPSNVSDAFNGRD